MNTFTRYVVSLLSIICLILFATPAHTRVTGPCSTCHTMHDSQNGSMVSTGGPYPQLLIGGCVGCHTGVNDGTKQIPFVNSTTEPTYGTNTLAGGNFYWAAQGDATKGHNVKGIPGMGPDGNLSVAPGNTASCTASCHGTLFLAEDLTTGCEGCHLKPSHHAPQQAEGAPALAANGYFRFLSECPESGAAGDNGVEGIEDSNHEYTTGVLDHNEYLGFSGPKTGDGGMADNGNTMTGYCTGCHGNFHVQNDGNANWIRHPSDANLPATGEYTDYEVYDPMVPVARPDLATLSDDVSEADMVMCLSCHRAHGSPNTDMLRWDYTGMVAGGGSNENGCFKCHSDKDL